MKAVEELVEQLRTHIRNETATIPKVKRLFGSPDLGTCGNGNGGACIRVYN